MPSRLTAVRPAAPFEDVKARLAAAVDANRAEILELSHRIHANPEPAFEEHQAAAWVAESLARHGFAVELPAGRLATAIRAVRRGGRGGDVAADRHPRRVRRAAGSRPRLRAQHDGRVRGRGGDRPRVDRRRAARRDRLPRLPGGRAGERQGLHDRGRPARGPRRRAALPPLRPEPRRQPAAGIGGRRRPVHRAPGARVVGPVEGPERARRDDPAVQLRRAVAAAAPAGRARPRDHPGGRDGGQHHPGPDPGLVHAAEHRPGLLRGDASSGSTRWPTRPPSRPAPRSR